MIQKVLVSFLVTIVLTTSFLAEAQQSAKVPRIGYLTGATPDGQSARIESFRQGLRELGYMEGKNIVIEYRYAEEKGDRLSALAAELLRLKVDVIVTGGGGITRAAVAGGDGERHIDGPPLAIHVGEGLTFGGIGHYDKVPVLKIRTRWGLLGNSQTVFQDGARDGAGEVEALPHRPGRGEEFIRGQNQMFGHTIPPHGTCSVL